MRKQGRDYGHAALAAPAVSAALAAQLQVGMGEGMAATAAIATSPGVRERHSWRNVAAATGETVTTGVTGVTDTVAENGKREGTHYRIDIIDIIDVRVNMAEA